MTKEKYCVELVVSPEISLNINIPKQLDVVEFIGLFEFVKRLSNLRTPYDIKAPRKLHTSKSQVRWSKDELLLFKQVWDDNKGLIVNFEAVRSALSKKGVDRSLKSISGKYYASPKIRKGA